MQRNIRLSGRTRRIKVPYFILGGSEKRNEVIGGNW